MIARIDNGRCQQRPIRKDGWTKAKRKQFLDTLATTCNVRQACREVGKAPSRAYALRRADPEFAQLWQAALDIGSARLEDELLAFAMGQVACGDNPSELPTPTDGAPFDPHLAMAVLKFRADAAQTSRRRFGRLAPASPEEIDLALMKRLEALAKRVRK